MFQTTMGGVITILLYIYVLIQTTKNFGNFLNKEEPVVQSYEIIEVENLQKPYNLIENNGGVIVSVQSIGIGLDSWVSEGEYILDPHYARV